LQRHQENKDGRREQERRRGDFINFRKGQAMRNHESLPIEIDPALGIDGDIARTLEERVEKVGDSVVVFVTSLYPAALAAEPILSDGRGARFVVRAASGDEVVAFHDGMFEGPRVLERGIEWQERQSSQIVFEPTAILWTGEVLLGGRPSGASSPFYAMESAAEAWAFHEALRRPRETVCGANVICWHCAESLARGVIETTGDYDRLRRFWVSPIRSVDVREVWLPWNKGER
jgi:hypothetical protein